MSDDQKPPIDDALQNLSDANSPSELIAAHREVRRNIRASRRNQSKRFGPLATAYEEMMELSDKLKAGGASRYERNKGIEAVLRQTWPFTREWKYECDRCNDTGLVMHVCRHGERCNGVSTRTDTSFQQPGKHRRLCTLNETYEHDYGVPCFCPRGARFREQPKHDPATFADAGRNKPTRLGRRS